MRESSVPVTRYPSEPSGGPLADPFRMRHSVSPQPEKVPPGYELPPQPEGMNKIP